nr:uncharacterized protein LOC123279011 [Equus asinus]
MWLDIDTDDIDSDSIETQRDEDKDMEFIERSLCPAVQGRSPPCHPGISLGLSLFLSSNCPEDGRGKRRRADEETEAHVKDWSGVAQAGVEQDPGSPTLEPNSHPEDRTRTSHLAVTPSAQTGKLRPGGTCSLPRLPSALGYLLGSPGDRGHLGHNCDQAPFGRRPRVLVQGTLASARSPLLVPMRSELQCLWPVVRDLHHGKLSTPTAGMVPKLTECWPSTAGPELIPHTSASLIFSKHPLST